jgi:MFS family permease
MFHHLEFWKYRLLLLFGIGISNIGDWIYLIALNLVVLKITHSPLAVAVLYILKPLATLFTNVWAGSFIDRMNKRKLMIFLDIFRAILLSFLFFTSSIWYIYLVVVLVNMASSIFSPTSIVYMAKLIPNERRKQFNSLQSIINSGAFLLGPAISGMLFIVGTPMVAVFINAVSFLISGLVTVFLPNLDSETPEITSKEKMNWKLFKKDWKMVFQFCHRNIYVALIYIFFGFAIVVMPSIIDSLEAAFAKQVLSLSDSKYGFLVSIAGLGFVFGAVINAVIVKKVSTALLIGLGSLIVSVGYVIYSFSINFSVAAIGFFVLSFFLAFANTGFLTFYQENVPIEVMGRVGSVFGFIEATLIIFLTILFGVEAQIISIQFIVIIGALVMMLLAIILCTLSLKPSIVSYYKSEKDIKLRQ